MSNVSRRAFVGATALSAMSYNRVLGANDRIGVGFIGFGLIGKQHVADFKKFDDVELAGMCDVYKPRLEEGLQYMGNARAKGYSDFRHMLDDKDIQAVVVSTPDHWHALLTIMACAAGKDVYVEKPMTVFIDEGKWMVQAARKYNRIVVVGTQRRHGRGVAEAKKVIESGSLGKIHSIRMASYRNIYPGFGKTKIEDPPANFDYDMWQGPAPKRPFQAHRGLYHFRWFWDYSGGQATNLGQHSLDLVHWIMGVKAPKAVYSHGGRWFLKDNCEVPDTQDVIMEYPGFTVTCQYREATAGVGGLGMGGLTFYGTHGALPMSRKGFELIPDPKINPNNAVAGILGVKGHPVGGPQLEPEEKEQFWTTPEKDETGNAIKDYSRHCRNFLDCVKSRQTPRSDLQSGHEVATACHLANISLRTGNKLVWDAEKEEIAGDAKANAMLVRPYRAPWDAELKALIS
jgi:predicted dehydrogenase